MISVEEIFSSGVQVLYGKLAKLPSCTTEDMKEAAKEWINLFHGIDKEAMLTRICRKLETMVNVTMTSSLVLDGPNNKNWLSEEHFEKFDSGYWKRYLDSLRGKRSDASLADLDRDTNEILNRCGNPQSDSPFRKKGLVIGDVQSGKTANFTGLICKAADAGYRIVIVIAGVLNSLRSQTQVRLERDFSGFITDEAFRSNAVNVTAYSEGRQLRMPRTLTTHQDDFDGKALQKAPPDFENGDIALLVIKKNAKTLEYVAKFFEKSVFLSDRMNLPVLIIDDEADNASVNSKKPDQAPSAINAGIRRIIALFGKTSYVGYTATPYANIFIDPEVSGDPDDTVNRMDKHDLFPRDFIYCLEAPNNYYGAARLFAPDDVEDDSGYAGDMVRLIAPEDDFLNELKQLCGGVPGKLPDSLVRAVYTYVLTLAIKASRHEDETHCSMLINITHRKKEHVAIAKLVVEELHKLEAASSYILLPGCERRNKVLEILHNVWAEQFEKCRIKETWNVVCCTLGRDNFFNRIRVLVQNSDTPKQLQLNYAKEPGQCVILIGGNSLSRGLTLEGLVTSYFLRNSRQYDTLMQMGRWFGFRDGYEELCRIFLTARTYYAFNEISQATTGLKNSIREMNRWKMTPLEFGLRVRNSADGLIVTARNKMRSALIRKELICFSGLLRETYIIASDEELRKANNAALVSFVKFLDDKYGRWHGDDISCGWIWENVAASDVRRYVYSCSGMRTSQYMEVEAILKEVDRVGAIDVSFVSLREPGRTPSITINNQTVYPFERLPYSDNGSRIIFKNSRFFSKSNEMGHISETELNAIKREVAAEKRRYIANPEAMPISAIPGTKFRSRAGRKPLLILGFAWIPKREIVEQFKEKSMRVWEIDASDMTRLVSAYAFSFSNDSQASRKYETWVYNKVKLEEEFLMAAEDDDDDYE